jgi:hypothetical protein
LARNWNGYSIPHVLGCRRGGRVVVEKRSYIVEYILRHGVKSGCMHMLVMDQDNVSTFNSAVIPAGALGVSFASWPLVAS